MTTARAAFVSSFLLLSACAAHAEDKKDAAPAPQGEVGNLPDFCGVSVSHGIQAEVKTGSKSVRLEGPPELLKRVKLEVEDGVLVTRVERQGFFNTGFGNGKVRLYVTNPKVERVSASGGAGIEAEATGADEFSAEASGGAVVKALEVKGVKTLAAEASGGSRVEADASESVKGEASGGSVIRLMSRPGQSDVDTSGGSKVTYDK